MHPPASRRSESSQQLQELEKRVHEFVQEQAQLPCSAKVCRRADEIALELGMNSFKSNMAWYTKFIKRHTGNSKSSAPKNGKDRGQAKQSEGRPAKEGVVGGGLMQRPSSAAGAGGDARAAPSLTRSESRILTPGRFAELPTTRLGTGASSAFSTYPGVGATCGYLRAPQKASAQPLYQITPQGSSQAWRGEDNYRVEVRQASPALHLPLAPTLAAAPWGQHFLMGHAAQAPGAQVPVGACGTGHGALVVQAGGQALPQAYAMSSLQGQPIYAASAPMYAAGRSPGACAPRAMSWPSCAPR